MKSGERNDEVSSVDLYYTEINEVERYVIKNRKELKPLIHVEKTRRVGLQGVDGPVYCISCNPERHLEVSGMIADDLDVYPYNPS